MDFAARVRDNKFALLEFLMDANRRGKSVVGYGAPAKANTLISYCGLSADMLDYTVDRNPHKQNRYLPGTRIPIYGPDRIAETRPDYLFLFSWNLADEIIRQLGSVHDGGCRFVVPFPEPRVLEMDLPTAATTSALVAR